MARSPGAKNRDHIRKRAMMLKRMSDYWLHIMPESPSLRELAPVAGVSLTNLRHYYPSKQSLYRDMLEEYGRDQAAFLESTKDCFLFPPRQGLHRFLERFLEAWSLRKIGKYHVLGYHHCFSELELELAYRGFLYKPLYRFLEQQLVVWMRAQLLRKGSEELAAQQLLAPVMAKLLIEQNHRQPLSRARWTSFLSQHISFFFSGWW